MYIKLIKCNWLHKKYTYNVGTECYYTTGCTKKNQQITIQNLVGK